MCYYVSSYQSWWCLMTRPPIRLHLGWCLPRTIVTLAKLCSHVTNIVQLTLRYAIHNVHLSIQFNNLIFDLCKSLHNCYLLAQSICKSHLNREYTDACSIVCLGVWSGLVWAPPFFLYTFVVVVDVFVQCKQ